jgi:cell division septation protein DedD
MAQRETAPGLSFGQLVTLTFGFLLASALIFAFGFWVGYDAAQRRLARDQQFVRLPVAPAPTKAAVLTPAEGTVEAGSPSTPGPEPAAPKPLMVPPTPPGLSPAVLAATASPHPPSATPSPRAVRTPTPTVMPAVKQTRAAQEEGVGAVWTVEAGATTDPLQAVMLAHRLREKGYAAYTATGKVGNVMWYRVRVGRFDSRVQAKVMEIKLKQEEGLKEASVVQQ